VARRVLKGVAAPAVAVLAPATALAAGSAAPQMDLVSTVGLAVIAASVTTIVFHRIRLPALLAYIVSGVLIGAFAGRLLGHAVDLIEEVSHIGLVFLLFIIGLEMDLAGIRRLGPGAGAAIVLQTPVAFTVIYAVQWAASGFGFALPGLGSDPQTWFFYAVACSLGSTAVVVKLLGDKFDLGSQAGKITVLTLVIEDIWAIGALSYVQSRGDHAGIGLGLMLGGGVALTVVIVLASRFLLARIMAQLARAPDLLMLIALGWCFLCAGSFSRIGLSAEMGALIAGLTIGRLPQHMEVLSRVASLRDFFMALFFVALGISLPSPTTAILLQALALTVVVIVARMLLYAPLLLLARQGPIVAFAASVNLAQISEFSLLIVPLGLAQGMLGAADQMVISYALMMSVVVAAFAISNNYRLAIVLHRAFSTGAKGPAGGESAGGGRSQQPVNDIVLLGYFVNADAIARHIAKTSPELLDRILVIDFNIEGHRHIKEYGMRVAYGDISNPHSLRELGVCDAKVVVSTISNAFLHGTRNEKLLQQIRNLNPRANIITTSLSAETREDLLERGSFACISTPDESAPAFTGAIREALADYDQKYPGTVTGAGHTVA
jgi:Kef-type K+ transport system membrane component KefB